MTAAAVGAWAGRRLRGQASPRPQGRCRQASRPGGPPGPHRAKAGRRDHSRETTTRPAFTMPNNRWAPQTGDACRASVNCEDLSQPRQRLAHRIAVRTTVNSPYRLVYTMGEAEVLRCNGFRPCQRRYRICVPATEAG